MKKNKFLFVICLLMCSLICSVTASEFDSGSIFWAMEFTDSLGGAERYTFNEFMMGLEDGTMSARYIESKPYMVFNAFSVPIPASEAEQIDIRISSENDMMLKFYFKTDRAGDWSEDRNIVIMPKGGSEMNIYSVKTSSIKNWNDNITELRMDFVGADGNPATNKLNLDYIRIIGSKEGNSAKINEDGILYDFEMNSRNDGWKFNAAENEASIADGKIVFEAETGITLETCGLNNLASDEYGNISISMQNETSADKARLYFVNKTGGEYAEYFEFDIVPNDNTIRTYTIVTGKNEKWKGEINGLKFDFGGEPGKITVDEIFLQQYPYTIDINEEYIKIGGKTKADSIVSVQIANADEDFDTELDSGNYSGAVIYTTEVKSDASGNFSIVCRTPESDSPNRFDILIATGNKIFYSRKFFVNNRYSEKILQQYNEAVRNENATLAETLITENYEYLGLDSAGYTEYCDNGDAELFRNQLVYLGEAGSKKILESNVSEAAIYVLLKTADENNAEALVEKYDSVLKFSQEDTYSIYSTLGKKEKFAMLCALSETAKDIDDYRQGFVEKSILFGISYSIGTDTVRKIIHDNKDVIGIDISEETSLKNTDRLYARLAGNLYNSYEDIAEAYMSALEICKQDEKTAENKTSLSGGGGGGGGKVSSGGATTAVMPIQTPAKAEKFSDIENFGWAKESIEKLYEKGIISGKAEGLFIPDANVSRAEFVKMLVMALDIQGSENAPFADVDEGAWYASYIGKAFAAGVINGNTTGDFCPDSSISRQDMAVIIYRAAKQYLAYASETEFADSNNISVYAKDAVNALSNAKIIQGMPDGSFMPGESASRAQTAVIIERLLKHIGKI